MTNCVAQRLNPLYMTPFFAELIGTSLMIFLGNSVVANVLLKGTKGQDSGWMVLCTGWALAVFVGVTVAGPFSGAHLNPAISIGLAVAGKFTWLNVFPYILAQMLGAFIGSIGVYIIFYDHFRDTKDKDAILSVFCTGPALRNSVFNFLSELAGTFVLIFVVFHITGARIKGTDAAIGLGSIGAIPVAFLIWVLGLGLGGTTGCAINPARDLACRLAHAFLPFGRRDGSDWAYAWIPIAGPIIGAILAALVYLMLD